VAADITKQQIAEALVWWALVDAAVKSAPPWFLESAPRASRGADAANITRQRGGFSIDADGRDADMIAGATKGVRT
jgi:hypothetical protein